MSAPIPHLYYVHDDGAVTLEPLGAANGVSVFTQLGDVPASYSSQSLKHVRVNTGATALEFVVPTLLQLSDFPANYTSAANKPVVVNASGTAIEFNYPTGVTNGGDASGGKVGEYQTATTSTISLVTATAKTIASFSLAAGDWEVNGLVNYNPAASTSVTVLAQGINSTADTLPALPFFNGQRMLAFVPGAVFLAANSTPKRRFSLSSTTTIYLIAQATFTVSTMTADGWLSARRIR